MIYKNRKGRGTKRGDRAARSTHYGNPKKEVAMTTSTTKALPAPKTTTPTTTTSKPKFEPVSHEVTPYGAKKFRTPYTKDEFTGTAGSPIPAYVFDIDGTLQGWGSGADSKALAWAKKIYEAKGNEDVVFLVITARDHGSFGYTTSFNWLMRHFPYPFIGPFARATDDPRFASEFKRELAQGFEDMGLYQIMGAADDNEFVINMWKQWAIDHFEDPKDFDLLECAYPKYSTWRSDLPSKGSSHSGGYGYGSSGYSGVHSDEHWDSTKRAWVKDERTVGGKTEVWVPGRWDSATNKYIDGYWTLKGGSTTKPSPASWGRDPVDGVWKKELDFLDPAEKSNGSITDDPRWLAYFAKREAKGAYTGIDPEDVETTEDTEELYNETLDEVLAVGYTPDRADLEFIVAHDNPDFTPQDIESMTDYELMELSGFWTPDEIQEMEDRKDESSVDLDDPKLPLDVEEVPEAHIKAKNYRLNIEDEVWARYEDLTMEDIQQMDLLVLEELMVRADNTDKHTLLTYHGVLDTGEPTGELKVSEVLGEVEGTDWKEGGRTYAARGGKLIDITEELATEAAVKAIIDVHLPDDPQLATWIGTEE
jgi:hypothetical protein